MTTDAPLDGLGILICDDEPRLRQILMMMVEELGADVIGVNSSEEAVQTYRNRQTEIDVVILDLRMDGMGGKAAFREIRTINPGARIIVASGLKPEQPFLDELNTEYSAFIEKPFDIDGLTDILYRMTGRSSIFLS